MVILIIMAVMAALVAPKMGNFYQDIKLTSTVHQFRMLLDKAMIKSSTGNRSCLLVIHPGWRNITLTANETKIIENPQEAVEYIKNSRENNSETNVGDENHKSTTLKGAFSRMELPEGVKIKYISVSGARKAFVQEIVIDFKSFGQPDEVEIVFENTQKEYRGLRLEPGCGIVHDLKVIKEY
jgi:type II secretory pathway pseudopilin PulG